MDEQGKEKVGWKGSVENSLVQIREDRATLTNGNSGILVHDAVFQKRSGKLDSEGVRATPTALSGLADFVFAVFFAKESNINSPNPNKFVRLYPLCLR